MPRIPPFVLGVPPNLPVTEQWLVRAYRTQKEGNAHGDFGGRLAGRFRDFQGHEPASHPDEARDDELAVWEARSAAAAAYRRMVAAMSDLCWAAQRRLDYSLMPSALGRSDHEKVATLRSMIDAPGPLSAYQPTLMPVLCTLADALDELRTLALTEPEVRKTRAGDVQLLFIDHHYQRQWELSLDELRSNCAHVRTVCDWATEVFTQVGCAFEVR